MADRNAPCPCGSGKKYKKCHGAAGDAQASEASPAATGAVAPSPAGAPPSRGAPAPTPARPASQEEKAFLIHTGRGLESEKTEAERKKHLRRRIQERDLKGTLVYNNGAFFRPEK